MVKNKNTDSVQMQVSGPKSIIPKPITVVGSVGMTWLHFLNSICGLKLDSNSDYYICTSTYTATTPESGWTANLNDQIKDFIDRYSRKRAKYCIRLHTGSEPDCNENVVGDNDRAPTPDNDETEEIRETATITPWAPAILKNPTPTKTGPVRKFASIVPPTPSKFRMQMNSFGEGPTRGLQTVTPIQPVLPQQQESQNGAGPSANPPKPQKRHIGGSKRVQSKPEPRRRGGANDPSPPKLTRFDDIEQPEPSSSNHDNTSSSSSSQSVPGTSFNSGIAGASLALTRKKRVTQPPRRYEEDSFGRIGNVRSTFEPVSLNLTAINQTRRDNALGQQQEINEEECFQRLEIDNFSYYDNADDNASMLTAASVEENEMRQSGIDTELDIKAMIEAKLDRFDNDMLHRIQREISKLKRSGDWVRNVKRSPLACYILTELFKE